jgi:hypothetical protein
VVAPPACRYLAGNVTAFDRGFRPAAGDWKRSDPCGGPKVLTLRVSSASD